MINEVRINFNRDFNDIYIPYLEDHNRYLVLYGGAGSGKSYFAAQKVILRIMLSMLRGYKERFLALRKTKPAARKSIFPLLQKYINLWGLEKNTTVNKTEMSYTFSNGSEIYCCGIDDPEKIKSIEGVTSVWLEEPTELKPEDFRQIDLRLRGETPSYKQIILSFNPISRLSWLFDLFFQRHKEKSSICKSTYHDNKFIDQEYKEIIENLKEEDENYYAIYGLGEWGELRNIIYQNWIEEPVSQDFNYYDQVLSGLDFGFNNPSAMLLIGVKDNELYIANEFYQRRLTNNQLIQEVKKEFQGIPCIINADSSEPARIEEFTNAGIRVKAAIKGPNSVKDGIDWVKRRKIHIDPSCINTIKEIQGYKYKEDKDGNVLDEPLPFNDHLMDALRYGVEDLMQVEAASTGDNPSPKPTATGYRPGHSIGSGSMAERIKRHDQRIHDIDKDSMPNEDFY